MQCTQWKCNARSGSIFVHRRKDVVRVDREAKESHVNKHKVLITLMLDFLIVNIFFYILKKSFEKKNF